MSSPSANFNPEKRPLEDVTASRTSLSRSSSQNSFETCSSFRDISLEEWADLEAQVLDLEVKKSSLKTSCKGRRVRVEDGKNRSVRSLEPVALVEEHGIYTKGGDIYTIKTKLVRAFHEIMRSMESIVTELSPSSSASAAAAAGGGSWFYGWLVGCHGLWRNVLLIVPSALFVVYLASQAKRSFSKVSNGRSHVVASLYAILWLVSLFNFAWCSLQAWECTPAKLFVWNVLSLVTTSGMLFLEVSLIAFLLQGNHASGREALTKTFLISSLVMGLDMFLKEIYVFGFGIQLFLVDVNGAQWGLWVVHKLLLTGVYGLIFFMFRTRWRERLPARPAFQNYISIMLCLNAAALLACALAAHGAGFGIWLYNITVICYHALYLPLLYVTFLADFFQEDDLHLESVYYSEMKDAGFFDVDWE